jgi:RimJ/RimL family protein N-acetyltransferase
MLNLNISRIKIEPLSEDFIERARELHNEWNVLRQLTDVRQVSSEQQKKWFQSISASQTSQRYAIINHDNKSIANELIGVFRIDALDMNNGSVMVGLDIAKFYRGNNLSYLIYEYFFEMFFKNQRINRIALKVLQTNEIALHVYEQLGFVKEGVERQAIFRDGKYVDYITMSILREEYEANADLHSTLKKRCKLFRLFADNN